MFLQRSLPLLLLGAFLVTEASAAGIKGATNVNRNKPRRLKKKLHGPKHRTCSTSDKKNEVKFECKSKTGPADPNDPSDRGISINPDAEIKDKIKYKIKTSDDGISVKLEYKNEVEMDDTETETKTKFELLFTELIEYTKGENSQDDSQAYDWANDNIVQSIPLTEWENIPGIIDDDEGIVSYFTATTEPFDDEGGTVAFNFTIARADVGEQITANSMKIDVRILDFPWMNTDSYVALLSTLESEKKVKVEYENEATVGQGGKKAKDVLVSWGGDDMASTFGFSTYGEYTWVNEAEAAGGGLLSDAPFNGTVLPPTGRQGDSAVVEVPEPQVVSVGGEMDLLKNESEPIISTVDTIEVIATSPEAEVGDDNKQSIAYSFVGSKAQGASDIYWDPEAGVGYESGVGQSGFLVGLAGTAIVSLLSLMA